MDISSYKPAIGNNHQEKLDVLCCCAILTGYSYDVKEFVDEINNTFRSDFKNDVGVHTGRFCPKCHAAVKHFTNRGSLSKQKVVGLKNVRKMGDQKP